MSRHILIFAIPTAYMRSREPGNDKRMELIKETVSEEQ